jgi:hypothetical protein
MRSIGFRAEKALVRFAVVESGSDSAMALVADDKFMVPEDAPLSDSLTQLRTQLLSAFSRYKPDIAGIRLSDRPQGQSNIQSLFSRARIEGVVIEAAGAAGIKIVPGASATIKSGMKTKRAIREYTDDDEIRGIDLSNKKNQNLREAVIAAISVLERETSHGRGK